MKKILKYEIKQLLRDKKTIFFVFVLPVILFPISGLIPKLISSRIEKLVEEKFTVAAERNEFLEDVFGRIRNDSLITVEFTEAGSKTDSLLTKYPAVVTSAFSDSLGTEIITVSYSAKKDKESLRASILINSLRKEKKALVEERFAEIGVTDYFDSSEPSVKNTSSASEMENASRAGFMPISIIMILLIGTFMISNYVILGEKDNNTLESLLSSGIEREHIVYGKVGMVIITGLLMSFLQMISFFLYIMFLGAGGTAGISFTLPQLLSLALMTMSLSVLISSASVMVSCRLKNSSSGQLLFMPLMILYLVLSLFGTFDGVKIEKGFLFIPIANSAGIIKAVATDRFLFVSVLSVAFINFLYSVIIIKYASNYLSGEEILEKNSDFSQPGGGFSKGGVFTIFAVLLVSYMMIGGYLQSESLVSGLVYSQIFILGGFSALMFLTSRSDFRSFFKIRKPEAKYIIAAVLLGLTARYPISLVSEQLSYLFPVPEILNKFDMLSTSIGSLSLISSILVIAVLPAVFEEMVFRGVFISLFERKYGTAGLAVVTGIMFGIMHLNIYSLFETAALGVLFGFITLYSGSIFPAVAAHFVNNAVSVTLMKMVSEGKISGNEAFFNDRNSAWLMTAAFVLTLMIVFNKKKPSVSGRL
jgi:sodium transport system permease protein